MQTSPGFSFYKFSASSNQSLPAASLGICQSPLGLKDTGPVFTPSG